MHCKIVSCFGSLSWLKVRQDPFKCNVRYRFKELYEANSIFFAYRLTASY